MNSLEVLLVVFQIVVLLFSLSLHEAAHAWMASRLGDQTGRMFGRVTLNPIKHLDPIGTVLIPGLMLFGPLLGLPSLRGLIGWAKPTPVNTRNFKHYMRDDILTTLAGPASNVLASLGAMLALAVLAHSTDTGRACIQSLVSNAASLSLVQAAPVVFPLVMLLYITIFLNLTLAIFNLLPLPPLDGSKVFRHLLPYNAQKVYDQAGILSLIAMIAIGGRVVGAILSPILGIFNAILMTF